MYGRPHCCYCKRQLAPPQPETGLSFSLDHVVPQQDGGWRRVPCCRKCNNLKGNLSPDDWFWFIRSHPRWWRLYDTPQQVQNTVREERTYRALNRLPQIGPRAAWA